jgi:predicted DNA-binding transcriptional regulator AlpA
MDDDIQRAERARRGTPYLNTAQAAHYLGISEHTMQRMRAKGTGPTPRRHAWMVQYHIDDLDSWSRSRADGAKS